jgi:hypothetical protein
MGLELLRFLGADHPARDAVGLASSLELLKRRQLYGVGRHHELAADLDKDPIVLGEAPHRRCSGRAQRCLEAAGLVVEAGVNHAGVVPGLMLSRARFLLEHGNGMAAAR